MEKANGFDVREFLRRRNEKIGAASKKPTIKIGKEGSMWRVYDEESGRTLDKHNSYDEAREQQKAIYYRQSRTEAARNWDKPINEERALEIVKEYYGPNAEWVLTDEGYAALIGEGDDKYRTPSKVRYAVMVLRKKKTNAAKLGKLWVVEYPTKDSKLEDIFYPVAISELNQRFSKGLDPRNVFGWYDNEEEARADAEALLQAPNKPERVRSSKGSDSVYKKYGYNTETFKRIAKEFAKFVRDRDIKNPGRRDFLIWMDHNHPDITPTAELREMVSAAIWGNDPETIDTTGNDDGKGVKKEQNMTTEGSLMRRNYRTISRMRRSADNAGQTDIPEGTIVRVEYTEDGRNEWAEGQITNPFPPAKDAVAGLIISKGSDSMGRKEMNILKGDKITILDAPSLSKQSAKRHVKAKDNNEDDNEEAFVDDEGGALLIDEETSEEIIRFIMDTPDIDDEMFNEFCEGLGIDKSEAESFVYQTLRNFLIEDEDKNDDDDDDEKPDAESDRDMANADEMESIARRHPIAGAPKLGSDKEQAIRAEMTKARLQWKDPEVRKEYGGDMVRYMKEKALALSAAIGVAVPTIMAFLTMQARKRMKARWSPRTGVRVKAKSMQDFIDEHREELIETLDRILGEGKGSRDDAELRMWILNDEGLYRWARSEGVKI